MIHDGSVKVPQGYRAGRANEKPVKYWETYMANPQPIMLSPLQTPRIGPPLPMNTSTGIIDPTNDKATNTSYGAPTIT